MLFICSYTITFTPKLCDQCKSFTSSESISQNANNLIKQNLKLNKKTVTKIQILNPSVIFLFNVCSYL